MDMKTAISIIGRDRSRNTVMVTLEFLSNMEYLNTEEERSRLKACRFVLRRWIEYRATCDRLRGQSAKVIYDFTTEEWIKE